MNGRSLLPARHPVSEAPQMGTKARGTRTVPCAGMMVSPNHRRCQTGMQVCGEVSLWLGGFVPPMQPESGIVIVQGRDTMLGRIRSSVERSLKGFG